MYDNQITTVERLFQNMNSLSDIETKRTVSNREKHVLIEIPKDLPNQLLFI
jgi:hypothetical protein